MHTLAEIKAMTDEEVAAENARLMKIAIKRVAISTTVVVALHVAVKMIEKKLS